MKVSPLLILLLGTASHIPLHAATTTFGPLPYRQKSDSPFYQGIIDGTIYLEDFEDGQLSPPGVAIRSGEPRQDRGVDEDDGVVDGLGDNTVWRTSGNILPDYGVPWEIEISFVRDPVRGYPTYVGFALLGYSTLPPPATPYKLYRGYDGSGDDFTGDVRIDALRLPSNTPYYSTAGDQFVGMYNDQGISKVILSPMRFDHLQFGWAVPEPGTATLSGLAAVLLLARRRRIGHLG